jgi:hypothetical protein
VQSLVLLAALSLLIAAVWMLTSEPASSVVDPEPQSPEPASTSPPPVAPIPMEVAATPTAPFEPDVEPDAEPIELPAAQRLLINRLASLVGDELPRRLRARVYAAELIAEAGDRVEADWRKILAVRARFQDGARRCAKRIMESGGHSEWEARRIRVADPDAPGRTVERLSTPYDGQREDEFILAVAVPESGRRLRHVVRLTPDSDQEYAVLYAVKQRQEREIRSALLVWLQTAMP